MKIIRVILLLLQLSCLGVWLTACGQKGPLYLPDAPKKQESKASWPKGDGFASPLASPCHGCIDGVNIATFNTPLLIDVLLR